MKIVVYFFNKCFLSVIWVVMVGRKLGFCFSGICSVVGEVTLNKLFVCDRFWLGSIKIKVVIIRYLKYWNNLLFKLEVLRLLNKWLFFFFDGEFILVVGFDFEGVFSNKGLGSWFVFNIDEIGGGFRRGSISFVFLVVSFICLYRVLGLGFIMV